MLGAAALTATLIGVTEPAGATAPGGVDYTCSETVLGLPVGSLPLHLDALQEVTVPVGGVVSQLTIATGLAGLVTQITHGVVALLSDVSGLTFSVAGQLDVAASVGASDALDLSGFTLPSGLVPGTSLPITAPRTFVFSVLGGVLTSLSCTIDSTSSDIIGTILVGPAGTDTTTYPADPPKSPGGSGTGTGTTKPRTFALDAHLAYPRVARGRHGKVLVAVTASSGGSATGRVVVRGAGRKLGTARLVNGSAKVRLAVLAPGRHRLKVSVLGLVRRLTLRVTR